MDRLIDKGAGYPNGPGVIGWLLLIFITLKLAGVGVVATWSWWWVLSPLWIWWSVFALVVVCGTIWILWIRD